LLQQLESWLEKALPAFGKKRTARRRQGLSGALVAIPIVHTGTESLEDRALLSGNALSSVIPLASPSFVNLGAAPNPGALIHNAAIPNATPAVVAPINPTQMRAAYGVNQISFGGTAGDGSGQTIAIVDAYNDPNIVADAATFNTTFGLPQFNASGGPSLTVLNQSGGTSMPTNSSAGGWDLEESLDIQWAHTIAPKANLILFEANSNSYADLFQAVDTARNYAGVSVVSMSFGSGEFSSETAYDSHFLTPNGHQGVTFFASTGDDAAPGGYPAMSSNVVAVGGTNLNITSGGVYISESGWTDGGGSVSLYESQKSYQNGKVNGVSATMRATPDVAMDADPATGVYVLDTYYTSGWLQVGGTSLSAPMWGGLMAIVNQGRALESQSSLDGSTQTLPSLYNLSSSDFHDITSGSNGNPASAGYDLVTGRGSPIANLLVPDLAGYSSSPHVPTVTSSTTTENLQSASGLIIAPDVRDAGSVAGFQITTITGGTLFQSDGVTPINTGDFITVAQGAAGLRFTPTANSLTTGHFTVQESSDNTLAGLTGSTTTGSITVNSPTLTVTANGPFTVAEGKSIKLSATAVDAFKRTVTYTWDVNGDSTFTDATGSSPTLTWAQLTALGINDGPAVFNVSVRVTDGISTVTSAATTLTVTAVAPTATLSRTSSIVQGGTTASVTFTKPTDPSSVETAAGFHYSYDFNNDGTFEIAGSPNATALIPAAYLLTTGSHVIHARITDGGGKFTDYTTTISVTASKATAGASTTTSTVSLGNATALQFTATDTSPTAQVSTFTFAVNFGDGTSTSLLSTSPLSLSHTYAKTGTFTVKVTATDEFGHASASKSLSVKVKAASGLVVLTGANTNAVVAGSSGDGVSQHSGNRFVLTGNGIQQGTNGAGASQNFFGSNDRLIGTAAGAGSASIDASTNSPGRSPADATLHAAGLLAALDVLNG
jgi:hypothetical protein